MAHSPERARPHANARLRARIAELEQESRLLRGILDHSPLMVAILKGPDFVYEFVSPAFQMLAPGKQFVGRRFADVWAEASEPPVAILEDVMAAGRPFHMEDVPHEIQRQHGLPVEQVHVTYSWIPLAGPDGKPDRILTLALDTTARVRAEEALKEPKRRKLAADLNTMTRLHKLATVSVSGATREEILGQIVEAAIAISGADFGDIQLLDPESSDLAIVAQHGFPQWWLDLWNRTSKGQGSCGAALERGERVIVEDVARSPVFLGTPALEVQIKAGVKAVQSTPLVSRSGKTIGVFSTHYRRHHRPDEHTLRFLDLLARQAADAIETAQYEAGLRQSEERLRALVSASSYVVYRMSPDWEEMRELDGKGFIADTSAPNTTWLQQYIHPDDQPHVWETIQHAIRAKSMFELEHRIRLVDGTLGWTLSRAVPLLDANGEITEWFGAAIDVTAHKKAEEEVLLARERLERATRAGHVGVWENDLVSGRIAWSDEILRLRGMKPGQFSGTFEAVLESIHPDDRWKILEVVNSTPPGGAFKIEFRVVWPGGAVRDIEAVGRLEADTSGKLLRWSGTEVDITERKKVEAALRESEERLRLAQSAAQAGTFDWDLVSGKVVWNAETERIWGLRTGEFEGSAEQWRRMVHPEDLPNAEMLVSKALAGPEAPYELEHRIIRPDGAVGWILAKAVTVRNASGEPIRVVGINMDITARKQAEAALWETKQRFATLFAKAASATVLARLPDGVIEDVSDSFVREFGYTREEAAGKTSRDLNLHVLPDSWEQARTEIEQRGSLHGAEVVLRTKSGAERVFLANLDVVQLDGQSYILSSFLDISERKRMEQAIERESQAKDEFLAMLGHEIRNPLAAINNAVQLLANATAEQRQALDELIARQTELLRRLVDDLLDISRITQGKVELRKEPVDLSALLDAAAMAARSFIAAREQEFVLWKPPRRVLFLADNVRLEQVIGNLLSNASRYTQRGGRIDLSGAREGPEVVIRCRDNGRGIPPEMQETVFDRFRRGRGGGPDEEFGLGIGLALVKRLAELHGGTVAVQSEGPGLGSEFTVWLPWLKADQPPGETSPAALPPSHRGLSVVIVEDNRDVARTRTMLLEQAGHRVTVFHDGTSALAAIPHLKPAAVLIDIGLPDINGYELAAKLRLKPRLRQTLLIGISGFKRRTSNGESADAFEHYFLKPLDGDQVLAVLESAVPAQPGKAGMARRGREASRPPRALLVEDNPDLAALMEQMLRAEGLEVRTALSGRHALELAADFKPQLILCDQRLPDMPGMEVLRALRARRGARRAHTVILSALSRGEIESLKRRSRVAGVDEFLSKPLTVEALRSLMAKLEPSCRAPRN